MKGVFQADGVKDGAKLVIAVGTLVEDAKVEIELGKAGYGCLHGLVLQEWERWLERYHASGPAGLEGLSNRPQKFTVNWPAFASFVRYRP